MDKLPTSLDEILKKKWQNFEDIDSIKHSDPGVYLLAYSKKDLTGKAIDLKDIFYAGMSNSQGGVKSRLKQFRCGIQKGYGHSGGNRFWRDYCGGSKFDQSKMGKRFYFVYLSFNCQVRKELRNPDDLRTMGNVCLLEYYLLAHIKEALGKEPELNKK